MSRKSYWVAPHFQTQKPSTGVDAVQVMCKKIFLPAFQEKLWEQNSVIFQKSYGASE